MYSPIVRRNEPPSPGTISNGPNNQEARPSGVARAAQTSSGVASSSTSFVISNGRVTVMLLFTILHGRMNGNHHTVNPAAFRSFVVVFAGEICDHLRKVIGERRAIGGGGETDIAIDREGGKAFVGIARTIDQVPDIADDFGRDRDQPAGGQFVRGEH